MYVYNYIIIYNTIILLHVQQIKCYNVLQYIRFYYI